MSCDTALNHVGGRRGTSLAIAMSVAISATILLLIERIIRPAATIEEVARCRAIQNKKQQWDCFKSLKARKQKLQKRKGTTLRSRKRRTFRREKRPTFRT